MPAAIRIRNFVPLALWSAAFHFLLQWHGGLRESISDVTLGWLKARLTSRPDQKHSICLHTTTNNALKSLLRSAFA